LFLGKKLFFRTKKEWINNLIRDVDGLNAELG